MKKTIIIAEAGVNHNGDITIAKNLIDIASKAGADYVKFQTFVPELNISVKAPKAEYQIKNGVTEISQLDMVRKLALSRNEFLELNEYCKTVGIKFLSTGFDLESIDLLEEIGIPIYKIPSGEITNLQLLRKVSSLGKPVLMSTGMANMGEIESALNIILENEKIDRQDITILHCNTEYPTPFEDVNLKAMETISCAFKTKVGYSDHTLGIEVPIAAVALGATVIEKHFTLDRNMEGPDHRASLEPGELKEMVTAIRNIEKAISGTGFKEPSPSELKNKIIARKSIHLYKDLPAGHLLVAIDLVMKRPGSGISPMEVEKIIGRQLKQSLAADHLLRLEDLV